MTTLDAIQALLLTRAAIIAVVAGAEGLEPGQWTFWMRMRATDAELIGMVESIDCGIRAAREGRLGGLEGEWARALRYARHWRAWAATHPETETLRLGDLQARAWPVIAGQLRTLLHAAFIEGHEAVFGCAP